MLRCYEKFRRRSPRLLRSVRRPPALSCARGVARGEFRAGGRDGRNRKSTFRVYLYGARRHEVEDRMRCESIDHSISDRYGSNVTPHASGQRRVARRVSPRRGPRPAQVVHRGWGLWVSCVPCLRPRSGTAGRSDRTRGTEIGVGPSLGLHVAAWSCVSLIGLSRYALALSRAFLWGRQS